MQHWPQHIIGKSAVKMLILSGSKGGGHISNFCPSLFTITKLIDFTGIRAINNGTIPTHPDD